MVGLDREITTFPIYGRHIPNHWHSLMQVQWLMPVALAFANVGI